MRTAEQVLREYIDFDDVNGTDTVEMLPLTIVDAMEEYAEQFDSGLVCNCPLCGEEMKGIELMHYKCKKCNKYFTN